MCPPIRSLPRRRPYDRVSRLSRQCYSIRDMEAVSSSQSLERGLAILAEFKPGTPELGISELARALGLSRSTSHRYVSTLARLGYLQQNAGTRKYRLGP